MVGFFFGPFCVCLLLKSDGRQTGSCATIQIVKRKKKQEKKRKAKKILAYVYIFRVASVCTQAPTERCVHPATTPSDASVIVLETEMSACFNLSATCFVR